MTNWQPSSLTQEEAALLLQSRRAARRGTEAFTAFTFAGYRPAWHQALLCRYLDRFAAGTCKRLLIHMPPRHGKSEHVSRRLPAYLLGRNPALSVIACSHTASLASAMNRDVQRVIDSPEYRQVFPKTQLSSGRDGLIRASDQFEVAMWGGSYYCAGVGGNIVGRGYDVGIVDDAIKSRAEADSPTVRDGVWEWYTGDFLTRRAPDAGILVIATRWHPEDLPGRLLAAAERDPHADQWEVLSLSAIREEQANKDDPRAIGEALWPEWYPLDDLEKTQAANPYEWWSQYQQRPRSPGSTEWPASYFDHDGFWFDDWPEKLQVRIVALDPSKGSSDRTGDYQALVLYGRDVNGIEYVEADLARRPMSALIGPDGAELNEGMVEYAVDRAIAFAPEAFVFESNVFQALLAVPLRLACERRSRTLRRPVLLPIKGIDNAVNKLSRIRRLGTPLAERRMRFKARSPSTKLLVEQLRQFPNGDHDDGPDALEMARRTAIHVLGGS